MIEYAVSIIRMKMNFIRENANTDANADVNASADDSINDKMKGGDENKNNKEEEENNNKRNGTADIPMDQMSQLVKRRFRDLTFNIKDETLLEDLIPQNPAPSTLIPPPSSQYYNPINAVKV